MSKFLTSVCTYNPPTHQPHPQNTTSNPKPQTYKDILLIKFLYDAKKGANLTYA